MRTFFNEIVKSQEGKELPVMAKDADFMRLWDVYNPLLTDHQREITDLYFNYDLSLGEIAEQKKVSRQSVSDCLAKSRKALEEYEEKLGFAAALEDASLEISEILTNTERWIEGQRRKYPAEKYPDRAAEIDELERAIERDRD